MTRWSAPGKLLLAGEYAVLRPGRTCLVAAVDRRLSVIASAAKDWSIRSGELSWRRGEEPPPGLSFAAGAVLVAAKRGAVPAAMVTHDELSFGALKLGLGSSAAATVATLWAATAVLALEDDERWGLADALHRDIQGGRGSGADVAASVFGGVLRHGRTPRRAARVSVHPDVRIVAIWTGASVKTAPRLATFEAFVASRPQEAARFESLSEESVEQLASALASGEPASLCEAMGAARDALRLLASAGGLELETAAICRAVDVASGLGIGAKLSGAGGGDCAVALPVGDDAAAELVRAMGTAGLEAFVLPVAKEGVRVDER